MFLTNTSQLYLLTLVISFQTQHQQLEGEI